MISGGIEGGEMIAAGLRNGATAIALLAGAATAQACEGSTVLFEDDFSELKSTWEVADNDVRVEDNRMIVSPAADFSVWVPNATSVYDDIDMCADVTTVEAVDPKNNFVGLVFWYVDDKNFYAAEFDANKSASIWRKQRGKWLKQIDWTKVSYLRGGDKATNQLRVVTVGKQASFYINGTKFNQIQGVPPDNGQEIGVIASSPEKGAATYAFANFRITKPE